MIYIVINILFVLAFVGLLAFAALINSFLAAVLIIPLWTFIDLFLVGKISQKMGVMWFSNFICVCGFKFWSIPGFGTLNCFKTYIHRKRCLLFQMKMRYEVHEYTADDFRGIVFGGVKGMNSDAARYYIQNKLKINPYQSATADVDKAITDLRRLAGKTK